MYSPTIFNGTVVTNTMGGSDTSVKVNEYTITESGKYVVNYIGRLTRWNENSAVAVFLNVNGNQYAGNMYCNSIEYNGAFINATAIKEFSSGDKITVYIYQYGNGNAGVNNLTQNDLQLMKIGN